MVMSLMRANSYEVLAEPEVRVIEFTRTCLAACTH
jgi:hypothetical protein